MNPYAVIRYTGKIFIIGFLFLFLIIPQILKAQNKEKLKVGDYFPQIKLFQNFTEEELNYLGLIKSDSFSVDQINGEIIIVEFLNKYCGSCQSQVPVFNRLYEQIEKNKNLKGKVKFIGICAGNNAYQVSTFKEQQNILFPLVIDPDYLAYNAVGQPRAPFTIILKNEHKNSPIVTAVHPGFEDNNEKYISEIKMALKLSGQEIIKMKVNIAEDVEDREIRLNENEVIEKIRHEFLQSKIIVNELNKIEKIKEYNIYEAEIKNKNKLEKIFVMEVYSPTVCDVCHDVHFWFSFNEFGKVLHFNSILLTKMDNEDWSEKEINKMRQFIVGENLNQKFSFDPEVDGITSATISAAIIFDIFNKTEKIYNLMKSYDLVK